MASGTFDRPLPDPVEEKMLLNLGGINVVTTEVSTNGTGYINIPRNSSALRTGIIILACGVANGSGMYIYGRGTQSSASIQLTAIKAPTLSGVSVSVVGNDVVIETPTYQVVRIIYFTGGAPTVSSSPSS